MQHKGYYDGFRYTYNGYLKGIEFHPQRGFILKDQPIQIFVPQGFDSTSLRYSMDGSLPTLTSNQVSGPITMAGNLQLKIKSFSNRKTYDKLVSGSFKNGELAKPHSDRRKGKASGLHYNIYEGDWQMLPDIKKLTSINSRAVDKGFKMDGAIGENTKVHLIEGDVDIPFDGYYIFSMEPSENIVLKVGNQVVVNGSEEPSQKSQSVVMPLAKGKHLLHFQALQKKGSGKPAFRINYCKFGSDEAWWNNELLNF